MDTAPDRSVQRTSRPVRNYSDEQKAKVLATLDLNAGNLLKTSRDTNIPIATISNWRNGKVSDDVSKLGNVKRKELADLCEDAAYEFIAQSRATIEHSKGTQAATGAAIFIDKMRLLRDESTVNIASNVSIEQTANKLTHLVSQDEAEAIIRQLMAENSIEVPAKVSDG